MELTADMFKDTLIGLKSERLGGGAENRNNPRVQLRSKIKMLIQTEGRMITSNEVWLKDISLTGMCLHYEKEMAVDQKFIVQLPGKRSWPITLLCTVKNCRPARKQLWSVGCSFVEIIPKPQNKALAPVIRVSTPAQTITRTETLELIEEYKQQMDQEMLKRIQMAMFD